MKNDLSILFYAKKARTNAQGLIPIYLRITIAGKRMELVTGRFTTEERWSVEGNRMKGSSAEAKATNSFLDTLRSKIYMYQQELIRENEAVNIENMRNKINVTGKRSYTLVEVFKQHNEEIKALVGKEYVAEVHHLYKRTLNRIIAYLQRDYNISDINLKEINHEFITGFEFFIKTSYNCGLNATAKYVKNLRKIIRICLANKWMTEDPFLNYKYKTTTPERIALSIEDVNAIYNKNFAIDRLNQIKDIFIFSCYTGLAYIDVCKLTPKDISIGIDGRKWIFTHRTKTDIRSNIPILPIAEEIIEKYKNHPEAVNQNKLLPCISNQKTNAYLKEIADLCGINKPLTFHIARHTFATTITLSNGVPIETVSKMLGHTNLKTTQIYAKVLDVKVSRDMDMLRSKISKASVSFDKKISV